ncbi:hypothetical protein GCM10010116_13780 [Microbispora rosea subsp. aerata]|nr:hypothetical protein [Microbispora rosea]GGO06918.1 hypothetical protein GCM10010116_13780 [Microbispora rosea subsp. aerata]GIH55015.1 hypothetical protein Mro02_19290 [Microbispora rosea subsp. aerata]GLJ82464.1 hypothetical protein GCM10017588_11890 [Microbispora rosea subsp. aerata]
MLIDTILNSFATLNGVWNSPIALLPIAALAAYAGWRIVEFIPFTRRIIERREGGQ